MEQDNKVIDTDYEWYVDYYSIPFISIDWFIMLGLAFHDWISNVNLFKKETKVTITNIPLEDRLYTKKEVEELILAYKLIWLEQDMIRLERESELTKKIGMKVSELETEQTRGNVHP